MPQRNHKPSFIINKFLHSSLARTLDIDVIDVGILRTLGSVMDLLKENKNETAKNIVLYGYQGTLAYRCFISRPKFNQRMHKYIDLEIFFPLTEYRGRSNRFSFGNKILSMFASYKTEQVTCYETEHANKKITNPQNTCYETELASYETEQASYVSEHIINNKALKNIKALKTNLSSSYYDQKENNPFQDKKNIELAHEMHKRDPTKSLSQCLKEIVNLEAS